MSRFWDRARSVAAVRQNSHRSTSCGMHDNRQADVLVPRPGLRDGDLKGGVELGAVEAAVVPDWLVPVLRSRLTKPCGSLR